MNLKANIRRRDIAVNAYLAIFIITLTGALAAYAIIHAAYAVPLHELVVAGSYAIEPIW